MSTFSTKEEKENGGDEQAEAFQQIEHRLNPPTRAKSMEQRAWRKNIVPIIVAQLL
jgi:hypothetical protein